MKPSSPPLQRQEALQESSASTARPANSCSPMRYRRFGKTELQMPVFSCGGMRYQYRWQDAEMTSVPGDNQANLEACIHRAFELGINHFETARGYGTSEMQLGNVLPRLPRDRILVQTKIPPFAEPKDFLRAFDRSMKYLQLDYVDLLAFHGVNNGQFLEWTLRKGGCLAAARSLQRDGRIRFLGFSTHATTDIIIRAIQSDEFQYVNLHWYFVNDLNWPAIEAAAARDMGVFIISPNDKGGKLYKPPPKLVDLCAPLSPMQFNALYCLARPQVHTLSCGVARPTDFDAHIKALQYYNRLVEVVGPIEARLRAEMEHVLGVTWCRHWPDGLPEYVDVPGQVNLKEILRLWTYAKSLDLVDWGKMRYNLLGQGDHWFPGEHCAKLDDRAVRAVVARSPFADQLIGILHEAHQLLCETPQKRLSES